MKISVVVPTIREDKLNIFLSKWKNLIKKHQVTVYVVKDGINPKVETLDYNLKKISSNTVEEIMGKYSKLIYNFNDGVRNLGFAKSYKDGNEIIISLDDDTEPYGDTIQDHIDILNTRQPVSWINTVDDIYMRGFPYNIRQESEVVFSHGLWNGVYDFDASTQLVLGTQQPQHRKMPIPKGILFPVCVMNVAFKSKVLQYYYQAPMFGDINRFADIWSGIEVKKAIDNNNWCAVSGYAKVNHNRASDPFVNLIKEARGIKMNEDYGKDEYFKLYKDNIKLWQKFLRE